jgi:hypothetical protein
MTLVRLDLVKAGSREPPLVGRFNLPCDSLNKVCVAAAHAIFYVSSFVGLGRHRLRGYPMLHGGD